MRKQKNLFLAFNKLSNTGSFKSRYQILVKRFILLKVRMKINVIKKQQKLFLFSFRKLYRVLQK